MKSREKILWFFIVTLCFSSFPISCKRASENKVEKVQNLDVEIDATNLESDFKKWWTYHNNAIELSSDFIAITEKSDTINNSFFLEKLTTGKFIVLKLKSEDNTPVYKLYELSSQKDKSIVRIIKQVSNRELKRRKMIGKVLPDFNFIDLNGDTFSSGTTKGKNLILKTWFIRCKPCIEEFPELNEFVAKHEESDDFIFVSLALDSKKELVDFLKKKDFKYKVIPDQESFINQLLPGEPYPTHVVIDKSGVILKVMSTASEMIEFTEDNIINNPYAELPPPPPPSG